MFVFPREKACWRRVLASVFSLLITSVGLNAELYAAGGYGVQVIGVGKGSINAVAYASDGTLVLGHSNSQDLTVIAPDGIQSTLSVTGATLASLDGGWIDPITGDFLLVDNKSFGDDAGDLYSINLDTGDATTLLTGLDTIADVAVRATGHIFVSDAAGNGDGGVFEVARDGGGITATVVSGLEFVAGLDFDSNGDLIVVQSNATFVSEFYRVPINDGGELTFEAPVFIASGDFGSFDVAVDLEDDVWTTGGQGLWLLDASDGFAATLIESKGTMFEFAGEMDFLPGHGPFEVFGAREGSHLTYVPDFGDENLHDLTVPEPTTLGLVVVIAFPLTCRRRFGGRQ